MHCNHDYIYIYIYVCTYTYTYTCCTFYTITRPPPRPFYQLGANLCELGDTINVQEATSSEDDGDDLTSDDYDDDDGEADAPANSGSWSFLGGSKGKGGTLASIFNATLSLAYGGGARIKWRRNSRSAPASYAGSKEDIADSDGRPVSSDKKKRKKHWLKKH